MYLVILIAILILIFYFSYNECSCCVEKYGEPPGRERAVKLSELDFRGWSELPHSYTSNTVGSMINSIRLSA
jgi:hypothetical protein